LPLLSPFVYKRNNTKTKSREEANMAYTVKDILRLEVAPALGCTEPVATALGAAAAVSILPGKEIDSIVIWVDPNSPPSLLSYPINPENGGFSVHLW
jgi:L-cysteine desulfidase